MMLPFGQNELIEAVLAANPRTVIVLQSGHAAAVALAVNPDPVAPEMLGEDAEGGEFPVYYAIPSTFGPLTGITLVVGAPEGEDQVRYTTILQTPAENTFVYNTDAC